MIRGDSLGERVLGGELDDFVRGQLVAFVLIGDEQKIIRYVGKYYRKRDVRKRAG